VLECCSPIPVPVSCDLFVCAALRPCDECDSVSCVGVCSRVSYPYSYYILAARWPDALWVCESLCRLMVSGAAASFGDISGTRTEGPYRSMNTVRCPCAYHGMRFSVLCGKIRSLYTPWVGAWLLIIRLFANETLRFSVSVSERLRDHAVPPGATPCGQ
jgi:hypothetical protein